MDMQLPANWNMALLKNLMDKTFPERRVMVTQKDKLKSVMELKEIYLLLFDAEAIKEVFERLMEMDGAAKILEGIENVQEKLMLSKRKKNEE